MRSCGFFDDKSKLIASVPEIWPSNTTSQAAQTEPVLTAIVVQIAPVNYFAVAASSKFDFEWRRVLAATAKRQLAGFELLHTIERVQL